MVNVLELFAGSRSVGRAAERLGMRAYSTDLVAFDGIDVAVDIMDFDPSCVPFRPDVIWASPPCTSFSVAAIGHHWKSEKLPGLERTYEARTEGARLGLRLVERTLEIIDYFSPAHWFIENPRGLLRKMPQMRGLARHTVTYCQYGDDRMKPTDVWTNSDRWVPRPPCRNGDKCHVSAPRGARTGTQGRKGAYDRSRIPDQLCEEILRSCLP